MRFFSRLFTAIFVASLVLPAALAGPALADGSNLIFDALPATVTAGVQADIVVEAQAGGITDTAYTGTVTLDTGDGSDLVSPGSHPYDGLDAGIFTFHVTFGAAGPRSLPASDGVLVDATGGLTVDVGAADASRTSRGTT